MKNKGEGELVDAVAKKLADDYDYEAEEFFDVN